MRPWTVLMVLSIMVAGCADQTEVETTPNEENDPQSETNQTLTEAAEPEPPVSRTYYLSPDGLVANAPEDGTAPLPGATLGLVTGSLADGEFHSDAVGRVVHMRPQTIELILWVQSDVPSAGNQFFDLAAWFGSSEGDSAFQFQAAGPLLPGQPLEVRFNFDLNDHPGIVLPSDGTFMVRVASTYAPEESGQVYLLTGAERSRFEITYENLTDDPFLAVESSSETFSGAVTGGGLALCQPAQTVHRFTVDANASWLRLDLQVPRPVGTVDVDLDLVQDATILWHAGSPRHTESILVAGPALAPFQGKELGAQASICAGGHQDYEITISQG